MQGFSVLLFKMFTTTVWFQKIYCSRFDRKRWHNNYKFENELAGNFTIIGYDPMNMVRIGDQMLCKTFIRLEDEKREVVTFFEPVLLKMKPGSANQVLGYLY